MTRKQRLTRKFFSLESLEDRLCLSSLPVGSSTTPPDAVTQARLSAAYGQIPLSFGRRKGGGSRCAAHNASGLAGESPAVGIGCLST